MVRGYWLFMVTKQLLRGKGRWKLVLSEILFGSVRHRPIGPCANRDHLNSHPFFRIICRQNRRARQIGSPAFRRVARTISVWSSSGPKIRCAICFNPPSATPPSPRPIRNGSWSSTARQRDFRLLVGHQILTEGSQWRHREPSASALAPEKSHGLADLGQRPHVVAQAKYRLPYSRIQVIRDDGMSRSTHRRCATSSHDRRRFLGQ
jgi:hypothetical protein